jgi:hydroxymethylbilane synthase
LNSRTVLRLGTRGSELALWQARRIADRIADSLDFECTIDIIKTKGDRIQDVPFRKMEGKGFFTKELQDALLEGRIDLIVHSLKDLPVVEPAGLDLIAIPERGHSSDLLIARKGVIRRNHADPLGLPENTVLGTSSLRRAGQALAASAGVEIRTLRGNVPTRIRRLRDGEYDAILLATAGVRRLGLSLDDLDNVELAPEVMLPAPGQGALAIETRAGDPLTQPLKDLNDSAVARCVEAERSLLKALGGGCQLPLGCLGTEDESGIRLQAVLCEVDDCVTTASVSRVGGLAPNPETVARVCFEALRLAMPGAVPE